MRTHASDALRFPVGDDLVVSLNEASIRSNLSVSSLKRCHKRGELRILQLSPRRIGVRLSDLAAFLEGRAA